MDTKLSMTKAEAVALFKNRADMARQLGISRAAVSRWKDDRIPTGRALTIRFVLKPEAFS